MHTGTSKDKNQISSILLFIIYYYICILYPRLATQVLAPGVREKKERKTDKVEFGDLQVCVVEADSTRCAHTLSGKHAELLTQGEMPCASRLN